jgi:TRAP transporter 4TM/12TM fusion protein
MGKFFSLQGLITLVAVCLGVFHLYTAQFGIIPGMGQRSIHITLVLVLAFLGFTSEENKSSPKYWLNLLLAFIALACGIYFLIVDKELALRVGVVYTRDIVFGVPFIVLVFWATKRLLGWPLVIVALICLAYALFGHLLPGDLGHRPYDLSDIIETLALTTQGIFGPALAVSATVIAIFVYFGAFLKVTGGSEAINDFSQAILGHVRGGPAKVAVLASCLFGSLSGSAVANVAATGSVTIPLMKRIGYRPAFAGAVEAVASSGGQIMPPIMGAAAFLMAEFLGIPYIKIVIAAIFPALLYYLAVLIQVDLEAAKLGLTGMNRSELPKFWDSLMKSWHVFVPVMLILVLLVAVQWTPVKAAFWSIACLFFLAIIFSKQKVNIPIFLQALKEGSQGLLVVASACAISGVVIGVFDLTGLGLKFSSMLIYLSMGNVYLLLILTMFAALILGMGMSTLPCYLVLAVIVAPALVKMGLDPLASHLFIFYFGIIAGITPPVCVAAFAAAALAESDPMETGFMALRLGLAALILPYMFIFSHGLLMRGGTMEIVLSVVSAILGIFALAISMEGYLVGRLSVIKRALFFLAAIVLIKQGLISDLIGLIIGSFVFLIEYRKIPYITAVKKP